MPIQELNKPYTECYVFDDPTRVYDLVGWNPDEKLYKLTSDDGKKRYLRYFEFCPISSAHDEEIEAGDDGKIYTVQQLVDAKGHLVWKRPVWATNGDEGASKSSGAALGAPGALGPRPQAKPKDGQAEGHGRAKRPPAASGDEAKDKVRELLAGCQTREDVANMGMIYLGEDAGILLNKYMHLDNGRFRMTIGNRMVGLYKKNGGFK